MIKYFRFWTLRLRYKSLMGFSLKVSFWVELMLNKLESNVVNLFFARLSWETCEKSTSKKGECKLFCSSFRVWRLGAEILIFWKVEMFCFVITTFTKLLKLSSITISSREVFCKSRDPRSGNKTFPQSFKGASTITSVCVLWGIIDAAICSKLSQWIYLSLQ